jgi:hypothetical protein
MEYTSLREAAEAEGVKLPTIHKWVQRYDIARQEGRRWIIDADRLRVIADASRVLGLINR